jgi:hypothetical protein
MLFGTFLIYIAGLFAFEDDGIGWGIVMRKIGDNARRTALTKGAVL